MFETTNHRLLLCRAIELGTGKLWFQDLEAGMFVRTEILWQIQASTTLLGMVYTNFWRGIMGQHHNYISAR